MLEMGEPIRILDLAETMIRLSGLEPERDIAIEIVGARPGEKFHEDLFNPYERPQPTPAQKILRAEREPLDPAWVERDVRRDQPARAGGRRRGARRARLPARRRTRRRPRSGPARPGRPRRLQDRSHGTVPFAFSVHHFITRWAQTRASPRSSGWRSSCCSTSRRRERPRRCASRPTRRPSGCQQLEDRLAQLARRADSSRGAAARSRPSRRAPAVAARGRAAGRRAPAHRGSRLSGAAGGRRPVPARPGPRRAGVGAPALTAATKLIPTRGAAAAAAAATPAPAAARRCRRPRRRPSPRRPPRATAPAPPTAGRGCATRPRPGTVGGAGRDPAAPAPRPPTGSGRRRRPREADPTRRRRARCRPAAPPAAARGAPRPRADAAAAPPARRAVAGCVAGLSALGGRSSRGRVADLRARAEQPAQQGRRASRCHERAGARRIRAPATAAPAFKPDARSPSRCSTAPPPPASRTRSRGSSRPPATSRAPSPTPPTRRSTTTVVGYLPRPPARRGGGRHGAEAAGLARCSRSTRAPRRRLSAARYAPTCCPADVVVTRRRRPRAAPSEYAATRADDGPARPPGAERQAARARGSRTCSTAACRSPRSTALIEVAGDCVDLVKLGWGTSLRHGNLERKLERYRAHGIPVVLGGTLHRARDRPGPARSAASLDARARAEHFEISDGTITMAHERKLELIERLAREFTVLSEVGSKDDTRIMAPYRWVELIQTELEAGAWKVIAEARESGNVGIFRHDGEVRMGLIDEIVHAIAPEQDAVRGTPQGPAGVVRAPLRAGCQPRQHRARRRPLARDDAARPALGHRARRGRSRTPRASGVRYECGGHRCSRATARPTTTSSRSASRGSPTRR